MSADSRQNDLAKDRLALIRVRLETALQPQRLEVIDESHKHAGHAGARDGRGHFRVRVISRAFGAQTLLARHRLIYAALGSLMQTDIHALAIEARAPEEVD